MPGSVGFPNRFSFIDEASPNDADYISQGLGNGASIIIFNLGTPPVGAAGTVTISYRLRRMGGTGVWAANLGLSRAGAIRTDIITPINPEIPLDFTTFAFNLSGAEIAALFAAAGDITVNMSCGGGPLVPFVSDALECSSVRLAYFA